MVGDFNHNVGLKLGVCVNVIVEVVGEEGVGSVIAKLALAVGNSKHRQFSQQN